MENRNQFDWTTEFPGAITVCDAEGIILSMNNGALALFDDDGGEKLIGTNVLDCHPEPSRSKLLGMMKEGLANTYTVRSKGRTKLITQQPWYRDGAFAGIVEISFVLPQPLPHHDRDAAARPEYFR
jgi:PAS domain-containing protein